MNIAELLSAVPQLRRDSSSRVDEPRYERRIIPRYLRPAYISDILRVKPSRDVRPFLVIGTESICLEMLAEWMEQVIARNALLIVVAVEGELNLRRLREVAGDAELVFFENDRMLQQAAGITKYPVFVDTDVGRVLQ